jgi:hypothetical protein
MTNEEFRFVNNALAALEASGHAIRSVIACREGITDELLGEIVKTIDQVVDQGNRMLRT